MSVKVETLEKNMAKIVVEVPAEELEKALQAAYNKNKSKISVPGFRKGKVPRQMVEKMYGPGFFYEDAANMLIPVEYEKAAAESGLEIVSRPVIDIEQIEKGKAFIFTAEVAVKPEVTLGEYKGLEVAKADVTVSEEEVAAELEKEREKNARTISVEDRAVENGDMIMLDFEGFVNGVAFDGGKGENYPLTIGSNAFIPGFEDQLVGAKIGEEIKKTAPNNIIPEQSSITTETTRPVATRGNKTAIRQTAETNVKTEILSFGLRIVIKITRPIKAKAQPVPKADGTFPIHASNIATTLSSTEFPYKSILPRESPKSE